MTAPSQPDPWIGKTIAGQFRIIERLGAGGMGSVYVADQLGMDRRVVVKVILSGLAAEPILAERFRREARTIARLRHPNIVQVLTAGDTDDGALYLAMELVPGRNLSQEMRAVGPMPEGRIVTIARQVVAALAAAHEAGVVHRDLKPANIMLTEQPENPDHVVVLDFGIAKVLDPNDNATQLTQTGMMVGTPAYMSPEQIEVRPLDGRSDIYSLGVILYEMATGANPFNANTPIESMMRHLKEPVPHPRSLNPSLSVSPELEAIIQHCLAKEPSQRPVSARELLDALSEVGAPAGSLGSSAGGWSSGRATRAPVATGSRTGRLVLLVLAALLVAGTALAVMLLTRQPDSPAGNEVAESGQPGDPEEAEDADTGAPTAVSVGPDSSPGPSNDAAPGPVATTTPPTPEEPKDEAPPANPVMNPTPVPTYPTPAVAPAVVSPTVVTPTVVTPAVVMPTTTEPEPVAMPDDVDPCDVAVTHRVICDRDWDDWVPAECDVGDGPEMHILASYQPARPDRVIPVEITRTVAPLVLVLNSYGETIWDLQLADGVVIDRVITSGYERSTVNGLPSSVRVTWRSGRRTDWPIMGWAWDGFGSLGGGGELATVAEAELELPMRSYAGCYNPSSFSLGQHWTSP